MRLAAAVAHVDAGHLERAVVGLFLHQVKRHAGGGHVGDAGVLERIELQVQPPAKGRADDVGPVAADAALAGTLGAGDESIVLARTEEVAVSRGAQVQLQKPVDHLVGYRAPAGVVVLGDVLPHPDQLLLDADVAHAQRQNLLVAHETVVAQQAHHQIVIALSRYKEVEKLPLLGVRQRTPGLPGQAALLLADLREGVLGDVVVLDHPVCEVPEKAEVVVVSPRGDARVHVDVEHERGCHVAVEGTDIRHRAVASGVEPRPQSLQIGIVRAYGVGLELLGLLPLKSVQNLEEKLVRTGAAVLDERRPAVVQLLVDLADHGHCGRAPLVLVLDAVDFDAAAAQGVGFRVVSVEGDIPGLTPGQTCRHILYTRAIGLSWKHFFFFGKHWIFRRKNG